MSDLIPHVSTHFRVVRFSTGHHRGGITLGKIYKISNWGRSGQYTFVDDAGRYRFWMLGSMEKGFLEDCSFEQNLKKVLE